MLDRTSVGARSAPHVRAWTPDDALLYSLALGAGSDQLDLVTENSEGVTQRMLPTYAALLAGGSRPLRDRLGDWPAHATVHGAQRVALPGPLPVGGEVEVVSTVARIADKGSGALLEIEATGTDRATGTEVFSALTSLFLRGQGWGEPTRGTERDPVPDREPDLVVEAPTDPGQALLYRLCGDRNPLHSDPAFAARAGFERPILHGLCTWGVTARVLLKELAAGGLADPLGRVASYSGRFRAPVVPGEQLTIRAWRTGPDAWAHTTSAGGRVVVDRGELVLRSEAAG
ncbi:MaoC family dehydratase [Actinomadura algeriensis]|uniref:Acyl dehydratase n=1 Tax=Actinomadura algeriensis TaxID=1679523 RepID=A0ABR9K3D1_9ACTN|nr:MaoC family dehydratase [Actinomadura algeriensis]MBE1536835.1 acyl dehydratase [Actinomadura algeriensis]